MCNGFNLALIGQLHADVTLQVHQNTLVCCLVQIRAIVF